MHKPILFLVPATFGLFSVAHAQTTLFSEQFDTPSRWSTPVRSPSNITQYRGTDWQQYPPLGNITPDSFNLVNTEWGNKPVQIGGQGAEGNFLRFKLSTYNPNNFRANRVSKYLWGTELQTRRAFGPPAPGHALDFESRLRLPFLFPSMIASFYTYSQKMSAGTVFSDELDFEYLGENGGNEVQLVSWNDFGRRNDSNPIPGGNDGRVQTVFTGRGNAASNSLNRADWHLLRFRWICLSPGVFRVEFGSKQRAGDAYKLLFTSNGLSVPTEAMEIHLNIWASDQSLNPTSAPGQNALMDVDWCRVTDVALPSALRKPRPKASNGRS